MTDKEVLHKGLLELRGAVAALRDDGDSGVFTPTHGICLCLCIWLGEAADDDTANAADELLRDLIKSWPGRGDHSPAYPVGGSNEYNYEVENESLWTNPRRLELLDWLVEETRP